ncbi:MAG: hypothetical protein ACOC1K_02530 [Nanoarchaeota archaeon]
MDNPLDRIYSNYRKNKGKNFNNGVPNPQLDGEFEQDFTGVRVCSDCGSFNISFDMSSNKTVCNDCKKSSDKPSKIDFEKKVNELREEDGKNIEDAINRGNTFDREL